MPSPAEPRFEDDASGEAWYQKGVILLEGRKQEREIEQKLRRAMNQSVLLQWPMLAALFMGLMALWQIQRGADSLGTGLNVLMTVLFILSAIDSANAKRLQALLAWIEHERARADKGATNIDGPGPSQ